MNAENQILQYILQDHLLFASYLKLMLIVDEKTFKGEKFKKFNNFLIKEFKENAEIIT